MGIRRKMYRDIIKKLKKWKLSTKRKPLIFSGARQVGKTYLLKEFGKTEYKQLAYINFENPSVPRKKQSSYCHSSLNGGV